MKEQFADYETSKMLNELGFDEKCFGYFSNLDNSLCQGHYGSPLNETILNAPLWQQVEAWLWKKHMIHFSIYVSVKSQWLFQIWKAKEDDLIMDKIDQQTFNDPTIGKIECIKYAIKYLHEKK